MLINQEGQTLRLFKRIEREIGTTAPLADIAQKSCDAFYETYEKSVVLVRLFVALPFELLPPEEQAISRAILQRLQITDPILPTTPVMTLLGTRGVNPAWGDRRASQNYRLFPLISRALIEAIPMTAQIFRLLGSDIASPAKKEGHILGSDIVSPEKKDAGIAEKVWGGGRAALFYVEHAARSVDAQGRKIIAAQDFVDEYRVQTVFGMARAYRDDLFFVQLAFCRHLVPRERARAFLPLATTLRGTTIRAVDARNVFPKP
jgi:hypothetical protein